MSIVLWTLRVKLGPLKLDLIDLSQTFDPSILLASIMPAEKTPKSKRVAKDARAATKAQALAAARAEAQATAKAEERHQPKQKQRQQQQEQHKKQCWLMSQKRSQSLLSMLLLQHLPRVAGPNWEPPEPPSKLGNPSKAPKKMLLGFPS